MHQIENFFPVLLFATLKKCLVKSKCYLELLKNVEKAVHLAATHCTSNKSQLITRVQEGLLQAAPPHSFWIFLNTSGLLVQERSHLSCGALVLFTCREFKTSVEESSSATWVLYALPINKLFKAIPHIDSFCKSVDFLCAIHRIN